MRRNLVKSQRWPNEEIILSILHHYTRMFTIESHSFHHAVAESLDVLNIALFLRK